MVQFFNREREMAELDAFLGREEAQLVGVYGRRGSPNAIRSKRL